MSVEHNLYEFYEWNSNKTFCLNSIYYSQWNDSLVGIAN